MVTKKLKVLFLGLSHIGQVYSLLWSNKISKCDVYDFNQNNLKKFKNRKFTQEEPDLNHIHHNNKIKFLKNKNEIKNYDVIFFTYDTFLGKRNGIPDLSLIKKNLKKIHSLKLNKKIYLFITSQVYPGFTDNIISENKNKKINTIYFVDTLKMGNASTRFLKPKQLIFGSNFNCEDIINKLFVKFKCEKYILSYKEAELIKISTNLFLFFSVSFSNIIHDLAKQKKINFHKTLKILQNDPRIGKHSYIKPSLGMSGGHIERDYYYFQKLNKNKLTKKILSSILKFNNERKKILYKKLSRYKKKKNYTNRGLI